ncbi:hypothetical protein BDM02DRAFT_3260337 [Thelephora ganbajun]|uniref:Uncharacterized protein n=1 Tax=Thelephora ganbajun TaxID=370292 RepID=A0ACB6ZJ94_THEGA|nr:hypothetical protein BDM02DRAFT_3260337 [Thelephora ganbajun]
MSSRKPPKEKTHLCRWDKCHGKAVSKSTFYAHGNSVKKTASSLSQRTRDLILSLPQTSAPPRTRNPRIRRTKGSVSTDGDPPHSSERVAQSDSIPCSLWCRGNAQHNEASPEIRQVSRPQTLLGQEPAPCPSSPPPETNDFDEQDLPPSIPADDINEGDPPLDYTFNDFEEEVLCSR